MLKAIHECRAWYRERGEHLTPADAWPLDFGFDVVRSDGLDNVLGPSTLAREDRFAALQRMVAQVIEVRRRILEQCGVSWSPGDWQSDGRLLLYSPEDSFWEGICEAESGGVFEVHDCPGFGLWVDFVRTPTRLQENSGWHDFLVSYVPAGLVPLVDKGIDVNSSACIVWADAEAGVPSVAAYLRSIGWQTRG